LSGFQVRKTRKRGITKRAQNGRSGNKQAVEKTRPEIFVHMPLFGGKRGGIKGGREGGGEIFLARLK